MSFVGKDLRRHHVKQNKPVTYFLFCMDSRGLGGESRAAGEAGETGEANG